jgi:hypothetical protein
MGAEYALILIALVLAIGITALAFARHDKLTISEPEQRRYQPDEPVSNGEPS